MASDEIEYPITGEQIVAVAKANGAQVERAQLALRASSQQHEALKALPITCDAEYEYAAELLQNLKHEQKLLDELEEREKRPYLDRLNEIRDDYRPMRTLFVEGEEILKAKVIAYKEQRDREREEEQRKLNEAANAARAKLEKRAETAMEKGKIQKAQELFAVAEAVVAPTVDTAAPKVEGLSFSEHWDFEIINKADVPEEYKIVDMKLLRRVVSALKGACRIKGVRAFRTTRAASGAKQA